MIFSAVSKEYHEGRDAESPRNQNLPLNDSNEKKRRPHSSDEFFRAKHPRSNSENSFFLTSTGPSSVPNETVNNYGAMDNSELDLVDSQRLDANHHMESVFRFVPLDEPLKTENSFHSPRERIDTLSDNKHECNVGSICNIDFGDNGHVFTSALSALSPRRDDKNPHQSERSQLSAPSSAQSKSAKVIHHIVDSFESNMVPAERTGTEGLPPRTSPLDNMSRLAVSTAFEDREENEFDNCTTVTTVESSSVSCRSRTSGISASRSVARSEVSVDRSWAQNHNALSYRNRNRGDRGDRSDSRSAASRASNNWVSAAPVNSSSYKVVPQSTSSRVSPYSSVSRRSTSSASRRYVSGKYNHHGGERSRERRTYSRDKHPQVSGKHSRDRSLHRRRSGSSSSYYEAERAHSHTRRSRSRSSSRSTYSERAERSARSEWSTRGTYSAASYSYAHESRYTTTGSHEAAHRAVSEVHRAGSTATRTVRSSTGGHARVHSDLPLEWWERAEDCKEAKARHTARIDHICDSREDLVLKTTLWKEDTVLEPNMFPCKLA